MISLSDVASVGGGVYVQFYRMLLLAPPREEVMCQAAFVCLVAEWPRSSSLHLGDVPDSRGTFSSLIFQLSKDKGVLTLYITM